MPSGLVACAAHAADDRAGSRPSSLLFFVTTNFAIWAFSPLYAPNIAGLSKCYIAALPFLRNMLEGDLFWGLLLFGGYWLVQTLRPAANRATGAARATPEGCRVCALMDSQSPPAKSSAALGLLCGIGAALFWAIGFVAARHGIDVGLSPLIIALHRFLWPGLVLLPLAARDGFSDFRRLGWLRAIMLTLVGGLPLAILSYAGFLFVPLGHGGIIQPACASLGGLLLACLVLREPLPGAASPARWRSFPASSSSAPKRYRTIGAHGLIGDLMFVAAGCLFATFGMLLRLWRIEPMPAVAITSVLSLAGLPVLLFDVGNPLHFGLLENLLQAVVQGVFAGAGAIYLFTRAVVLLGVSRAAVFPSLVPPFTLLIGFLGSAWCRAFRSLPGW